MWQNNKADEKGQHSNYDKRLKQYIIRYWNVGMLNSFGQNVEIFLKQVAFIYQFPK